MIAGVGVKGFFGDRMNRMDRMQAGVLPGGTHPVNPVILSEVKREVPVGDCWHRVDPAPWRVGKGKETHPECKGGASGRD